MYFQCVKQYSQNLLYQLFRIYGFRAALFIASPVIPFIIFLIFNRNGELRGANYLVHLIEKCTSRFHINFERQNGPIIPSII